jgi:hypothetical protein
MSLERMTDYLKNFTCLSTFVGAVAKEAMSPLTYES